MSRPANAEGYLGLTWLWYTLVRPLTSARDCTSIKYLKYVGMVKITLPVSLLI